MNFCKKEREKKWCRFWLEKSYEFCSKSLKCFIWDFDMVWFGLPLFPEFNSIPTYSCLVGKFYFGAVCDALTWAVASQWPHLGKSVWVVSIRLFSWIAFFVCFVCEFWWFGVGFFCSGGFVFWFCGFFLPELCIFLLSSYAATSYKCYGSVQRQYAILFPGCTCTLLPTFEAIPFLFFISCTFSK